MTKRQQAIAIANQVLREDASEQWVRPLAEEFLALLKEPPLRELCGETGRVLPLGLRESGGET